MRSLQLTSPRSFTAIEEPTPALPGPGWLLVEFTRALICGTDLPYFNGRKPIAAFPMEPGRPIHECSGIVRQSTSQLFSPGDRVVAMPKADQGLKELYLAREEDACPVPEAIEDWDAATLIQPLSTVIYGMEKLGVMEKLGQVRGASAMVVGAGAIGLLSVWCLAQGGAGPITVLDPVQARLDLARELGATRTLALESGQALALRRGGSLDLGETRIVVEAVGHQLETVNHCLDLAAYAGTVLALGVPDQPVYPFEFNMFFRKNLTMVGSVTPPWREYLEKAGALMARHPELKKLVTDRFPLERTEEAFRLAESRGSAGKVALLPFG